MAEQTVFENILFEACDPMHYFAVVDGSGNIRSASDAMRLLLNFTSADHTIYSFLDEIRLADFFRSYLQNPQLTHQSLSPEKESYVLTACPLGLNHLITLLPRNGRPSTEAVLRRLMHDVRTPLSTALMAVSNLDFILEEESGPAEDADYSPKEFTGSAAKALQEIKEKLDIISILTKMKKDVIKQTDFIAVLDALFLPALANKKIELKHLMLHIHLKAVKTALELITELFQRLSPPGQPLNIRLKPNKNKRCYMLEITNLPEDKSHFDIVQPLPYANLTENVQIQLALAEHILFKNNMLMTGKIHPESHIFNLIIFIPTEEQ